jgi:hypothetical protein
MDTLESRVKALERENRGWRRVAVLSLAILGGVVLMGQAPRPEVSNEVRTRSLVIVDQTGQQRASLGVEPYGAMLFLCDEAGTLRASLGVDPNGLAALALGDEAGKLRASLGVVKNGHVTLLLSDEAGRARAALGVGGLSVFDSAGKPRVGLFVGEEGPTLTLADASGKPRASFGVFDSVTSLTMRDEAGQLRVGLRTDKDGPLLRLEDADGYAAALGVAGPTAQETGTQSKRSAASLLLLGKAGQVIWKAPR